MIVTIIIRTGLLKYVISFSLTSEMKENKFALIYKNIKTHLTKALQNVLLRMLNYLSYLKLLLRNFCEKF